MKNTDNVTAVGYTTGMKGIRGEFGTKIRFTLGSSNTNRTKELAKLGAADIFFIPTPHPMSKADALRYLQSYSDPKLLQPEVQRAMAHAAKRIFGLPKPKLSKKAAIKQTAKSIV